MSEFSLRPRDPKGHEALELILRLAAVTKENQGAELGAVMTRLAGDELLGVWLVHLAGLIASAYAHTLEPDDLTEGLSVIEKSIDELLDKDVPGGT